MSNLEENIFNIAFLAAPFHCYEKKNQTFYIFASSKIITNKKSKRKEEEDIQIIIQHWLRTLNIKLGWIHDFNKLVVNYVMFFLSICFIQMTTNIFNSLFIAAVPMLDTFRSFSKLTTTLNGHTSGLYSIDYSTFDDNQLICSASADNTVRVWDIETNEQIRSFNGHSKWVFCVKFSQYHYHNNNQNVVCSSSDDKTIRFWDIKENSQLQIFNGTYGVCGIEFSPFNGGRYLCSGSRDSSICLWDVETSKSLHVFNGHTSSVWCIDISSLQSNNSNESNNVGVIGGNGYTICSGSFDNTIRIWDIETTKSLIVFEGHEHFLKSIKYGSNELGTNGGANTILSGSNDKSVRLWDIRSGRQIQMFKKHKNTVYAVEYSPFISKNIEVGDSSNVICSGSSDNTIRFWDIRSNKNELYLIDGGKNEENGIRCFKFLKLKDSKKSNNNRSCGISLCYGSNSQICIWR
ncbi:hypothetical protein RFI_18599 [Reticulomyxa filosa]|uniref:Uncharacterized protein n=1 Tax=Reticulomyxa filosa TaxID=46433 RepID=X6MYU7_RETFI|nr:hypothetical protein RFI_18599 [Reticulomyxa filosa]|eukprot:ETO18664.1 hypothetical protein RFI_18599 [Reticulomyxa filosa]